MDIAKSGSIRRGNPIKAVPSPVDHHSYYIINSDLTKGIANVHFVDFYGGLAQLSPIDSVSGVERIGTLDGFFFVRDAADFGVPGDGQGDNTVHAGWAMYIWDAQDYIKRKPRTNAGWVKICQQGDVDWDITDELKAMFVLKSVFNARCNAVDNRFKIDESLITAINQRLVIIEQDWPDVLAKKHWHTNKEVLDELSDKYGLLYYRDRLVSGNSYVYDHIKDGKIVWCDPTLPEADWTYVPVDNSKAIADLINGTEFARIGLSLFVVEVDGSISLFKYIREPGEDTFTRCSPNVLPSEDDLPADATYVITNNSLSPADLANAYSSRRLVAGDRYYESSYEEALQLYREAVESPDSVGGASCYIYESGSVLVPKFAQTIVQDNYGLAEFVDFLPTADVSYSGRGCWVPLYADGDHHPGHLHVCEHNNETNEWYWRDLNPDYGTTLVNTGSHITLAYSEDYKMWKKNYIFWDDPTVDGGEEGDDDRTATPPRVWAKAVLVRKIGSAPTDIGDGVVVCTSTTRGAHSTTAYEDTIPFTDEKVYYKVFSETTVGNKYKDEEAVESTKLDWSAIMKVIRAGRAGLIFSVGSRIVLPPHSIYGDIECEVVAINQRADGDTSTPGILVAAKDIMCMKCLDAPEPSEASGVANPEALLGDTAPGVVGSNGEIMEGKHNLGSLNIIRWLNSTANNWYDPQTAWDQKPDNADYGYIDKNDPTALESGFLAGFEAKYVGNTDESIFRDVVSSSEWLGTIAKSYLERCKVILPFIREGTWSDYISPAKQLGVNLPYREWATLNPGSASSGITSSQRKNFGFMTMKQTTPTNITVNIVWPDTVVGIVPVFYLG